ncbi:hypothetical protein [Flammeovirga sp. SJP92]|uniref:hypothetical protein n=1 Tax=Flammeovirga sp. SJP92 TaxID=1775430 RepID=UPI0012F9D595|nr:hypothetical protein [Flammeovirga sp. SJP92]
MKTLYKILLLTIIDFGLIWLWVYLMDPDPSISITIILLVPLVLVINLIIGGLLLYFKKKDYSKLFFINSILASIIMNYLFGKGIDRHLNTRFESWEFQKADSTFRLNRKKKTDEFSMSYSLSPSSSTVFLYGKCTEKNGEWHLSADSLNMKIINDTELIGFRNQTDTIKMNKLVR